MTGNSGVLVIQERDRLLLSRLETLRVIDREQAKLVAGFGSTSRANVRLLAMVRAGLLKRAFVGTRAGGQKALYSITTKGAAVVGRPVRGLDRPGDALLVGDLFVEHQLAVNTVLLAFQHHHAVSSEVHWRKDLVLSAPLSPEALIVPDGYVEVESGSSVRPMFFEVDRGTESSRIWNRKVDAYLKFAVSGDFLRRFHHPQFRVLVIANTYRRLDSLIHTVQQRTSKIFWFTTIDDINRAGIWSAIWQRPNDASPRALF